MSNITTNNHDNQTVSVGEWVLTIFLTGIPLVGLILLIVWSFSSGIAPSKQNWARATLIWMIIGIAVATIFSILFAAGLTAFFSNANIY